MIDKLKPIIEQLKDLELRAYNIYKTEVDSVLSQKTNDVKTIERILDGLLGFCYDDQMFSLYKQLCRYYWELNPQATAAYINFYREMWDSESLEEG